MSAIATRVQEIITTELGLEREEVTPTARLVEDLGADSLDRINAMMALEEEFQVLIDDPEAEACKTVADVVALVGRKLSVGEAQV